MTARGDARREPLSLLFLSFAQMLASTAAGATITVVSPSLAAVTGADAMAGWGQTCTIVGAASLAVPVARLAERKGRGASLAIAFGLAAGGALVAAGGMGARSIGLCLVGLVAVGAGTVAALALRYAAADASDSPRRRARSVGIVLASATLGSFLGPNAVGWGGVGPSAEPYLLIAALYLCAAGASLCARLPAARPRETSTTRQPIERTLRRAAAAPIAIMVAGHAAMIALMGMAPVHLMHAAVPPSTVGWVMSAHLVAMYAASPVFGVLTRRLGTAWSGIVAILGGVVACSVLAIEGGDVLIMGAGLVLLGLAWSLGMVSCSVALADIPSLSRLRIQGRGDLALNVAAGGSSLLAGVVVAVFGYERLALLVGVGLGVVMVAAFGVRVSGGLVQRRGRVPRQPSEDDQHDTRGRPAEERR